MILEKLESRKKKKKVLENASKYYGFKEELKKYDLRLSGRDVFLLDNELGRFLDSLPNDLKEKIVHAGIKVGEVGRKFRFSLEGSFFLIKKEKKKVYIDRKAEMLFLYGRDVFSKSILKATADIKENDIVFVCNLYGDVIGIGKAKYSAKDITRLGEKVVVYNLIDRGEYLRKEKLYKSF